METDKIPTDLMKYTEELEKRQNEIRDDETKKILRDLLNQLNTLKLSKGLTYNQIDNLKTVLKGEVLEKDEYSDYSFIPNLRFYFDSDFNYMALSARETLLLSSSINNLIDRINALNEELEEKQLKDIEFQNETRVEGKEIINNNDEDELLEEDEEIALPISTYVFECDNCKNEFNHAYTDGCRKCGKHIFGVKYISR